MKLTQKRIAKHLDLSQQSVSKFMAQAGLDWTTSTLDDVRLAYLRKLRSQADSLVSEEGFDLVGERIMTECVDRELKQFALDEKKKQLINMAQLEPMMKVMVGAFRTAMLSFDDMLKVELDARYGIDVDIKVLNGYGYSAFEHLAPFESGNYETFTNLN